MADLYLRVVDRVVSLPRSHQHESRTMHIVDFLIVLGCAATVEDMAVQEFGTEVEDVLLPDVPLKIKYLYRYPVFYVLLYLYQVERLVLLLRRLK